MRVTRTARYLLEGIQTVVDCWEASDVFGRPWGFVFVPSTGHGSVILDCDTRDVDLTDPQQTDRWVVCLGLWLAMLTHEPDLVACAVTMERGTPDDDPLDHDRSDQDRSDAAGSPSIRTRIQLTYKTVGPYGLGDVPAVATEVAARIPDLLESIERAGIGTAHVATSASVTDAITSAYARPATGNALPLSRARYRRPGRLTVPVTPLSPAVEQWDHLRHGPAASVTWSMSEVAPSVVLSSVVAQLATDEPDKARTRVTLLHRRPETVRDPAAAGWEWTGRPPTAPGGQGLVTPKSPTRFAMLVTVTAAGPARLSVAAGAVLDGLEASVRPWLRPLYGSQAAAFAAGLPTGTVLARHANPPTLIRTTPLAKEMT